MIILSSCALKLRLPFAVSGSDSRVSSLAPWGPHHSLTEDEFISSMMYETPSFISIGKFNVLDLTDEHALITHVRAPRECLCYRHTNILFIIFLLIFVIPSSFWVICHLRFVAIYRKRSNIWIICAWQNNLTSGETENVTSTFFLFPIWFKSPLFAVIAALLNFPRTKKTFSTVYHQR